MCVLVAENARGFNGMSLPYYLRTSDHYPVSATWRETGSLTYGACHQTFTHAYRAGTSTDKTCTATPVTTN
jgi:hypothetical protein